MDRVLCFGEVLWDLLPRGRFLGGAPLNVAYHLARLELAVQLVSRVGADPLGAEAVECITDAGIDASAVPFHPTLPTGTAEVQLDAAGQAQFHLLDPAAWDDIRVEPAVPFPDGTPDAIVYGTLALRRPGNRAALARLLHHAPAAWIVCDVNLRAPYDDLAPLDAFLRRAAVLKLNEDEAHRLAGLAPGAGDLHAVATHVQRRFGVATVCITRGGAGAALAVGDTWLEVASPPVRVRDTVGAGDAFTAAFVATALQGRPSQPDWPRVLRRACALGAFVASQDGAQPGYEVEDVEGL